MTILAVLPILVTLPAIIYSSPSADTIHFCEAGWNLTRDGSVCMRVTSPGGWYEAKRQCEQAGGQLLDAGSDKTLLEKASGFLKSLGRNESEFFWVNSQYIKISEHGDLWVYDDEAPIFCLHENKGEAAIHVTYVIKTPPNTPLMYYNWEPGQSEAKYDTEPYISISHTNGEWRDEKNKDDIKYGQVCQDISTTSEGNIFSHSGVKFSVINTTVTSREAENSCKVHTGGNLAMVTDEGSQTAIAEAVAKAGIDCWIAGERRKVLIGASEVPLLLSSTYWLKSKNQVIPKPVDGPGNAVAGHIGKIKFDFRSGSSISKLTLKKFDGKEQKEGLCTQEYYTALAERTTPISSQMTRTFGARTSTMTNMQPVNILSSHTVIVPQQSNSTMTNIIHSTTIEDLSYTTTPRETFTRLLVSQQFSTGKASTKETLTTERGSTTLSLTQSGADETTSTKSSSTFTKSTINPTTTQLLQTSAARSTINMPTAAQETEQTSKALPSFPSQMTPSYEDVNVTASTSTQEEGHTKSSDDNLWTLIANVNVSFLPSTHVSEGEKVNTTSTSKSTPTLTTTSTITPTSTSFSTSPSFSTSTSTPSSTSTSISSPTPTPTTAYVSTSKSTSTLTLSPTLTAISTSTPTSTSTTSPTSTFISNPTPSTTSISSSKLTSASKSTSSPYPSSTSISTPTPSTTSISTSKLISTSKPTPSSRSTSTSTQAPTTTSISTSKSTSTAKSTSAPSPSWTSISSSTQSTSSISTSKLTSTSKPTPSHTATSTPTPTTTPISTSRSTSTAKSTSSPSPSLTSISSPKPSTTSISASKLTSTSKPTPTPTTTSISTSRSTSTSTPTPTSTSISTPKSRSTPTTKSTSTSTKPLFLSTNIINISPVGNSDLNGTSNWHKNGQPTADTRSLLQSRNQKLANLSDKLSPGEQRGINDPGAIAGVVIGALVLILLVVGVVLVVLRRRKNTNGFGSLSNSSSDIEMN